MRPRREESATARKGRGGGLEGTRPSGCLDSRSPPPFPPRAPGPSSFVWCFRAHRVFINLLINKKTNFAPNNKRLAVSRRVVLRCRVFAAALVRRAVSPLILITHDRIHPIIIISHVADVDVVGIALPGLPTYTSALPTPMLPAASRAVSSIV
jgi:hypothetical protein